MEAQDTGQRFVIAGHARNAPSHYHTTACHSRRHAFSFSTYLLLLFIRCFAGQCNDSYSAAVVALKLAEVLKVGVNELPLSIVLSWLEQKAVAVLLSLLHLGVKNIRIGPSLPAFITPAALDILVKNFNLQPIKADAEDGDVAAVMGKA